MSRSCTCSGQAGSRARSRRAGLTLALPCILTLLAACPGSTKSGKSSSTASGGSSGAASSGSGGAGPTSGTTTGAASTGAASGSGGSVSTGASSGSGGEVDCFSAFDAASCAALGDTCAFEASGGYFTWNGGPYCLPVDDPGFGWCFPVEHGGAGAPQAFWEPATGRVVAFATWWTETPPGWELCVSDPGEPPCCKCLSSGAPPECEQNDSIGGDTSTGGGGTGGTSTGG